MTKHPDLSSYTVAELQKMALPPSAPKRQAAVRSEIARRSAAYTAACRTQRAAYFAWQAAPAGDASRQIAEYEAASRHMRAMEG